MITNCHKHISAIRATISARACAGALLDPAHLEHVPLPKDGESRALPLSCFPASLPFQIVMWLTESQRGVGYRRTLGEENLPESLMWSGTHVWFHCVTRRESGL